ncbi:SGNH/GDSL hydrolase family protein [Curtobacterium pusillum]|uniref:SGNH/GDSL hydrolase family protein n=1 Tax=Curtobacterium pusillum TaxID=69373 RepID=UPI001643EF9F|nr:SGNH/GDSL hydrolase family protein [Curtobacterium pusillum]
MRVMRWVLVGIVVVTAVTLSMVTVDRSTPLAAGSGRPGPLRIAVVGDSLSAGRSRFLGNGLDDGTWITSAVGDGIEFVGGWARSGATPDQMAESVRPVSDVDVLVILAGTNAVRLHRTLGVEAAAYRSIVRTVHPRTVLIAAIPPYHWQPHAAMEYNQDLRRLADREGWSWGDPWKFARNGAGWVQGVSDDGTHPAGARQYRELGSSMRTLIEHARDDHAIPLAAD